MTDQELADRVLECVKALNTASADAEAAGLKVKFQTDYDWAENWSFPVVWAKVVRVLGETEGDI